ncbi:MAG: hypothetical protein JWQ35_1310 [Bacteriovoracaceae bacterium]|nr:hypothetical protein [Bacteriovoracaceae bacterium]
MRGNQKGFSILTSTWLVLLFSLGLMVTAHFLGERMKGMKRIDRLAGHIHRLHQDDVHGKRHFRKTFDSPPHKKLHVSNLKKVTRHRAAIDFGGDTTLALPNTERPKVGHRSPRSEKRLNQSPPKKHSKTKRLAR